MHQLDAAPLLYLYRGEYEKHRDVIRIVFIRGVVTERVEPSQGAIGETFTADKMCLSSLPSGSSRSERSEREAQRPLPSAILFKIAQNLSEIQETAEVKRMENEAVGMMGQTGNHQLSRSKIADPLNR